MCIDPQSTVWVKRGPKWVKVPKPCGDCWQCRENYVNDWVGRCLAEAATSALCCTLSLTYAPPKDWRDISHRVVQPLHFQLFMKRLRKAGHKVRYLVAGEYGEDRGRAHFHCILFFQHLVPGKRPASLENRAAFAADPSIAAPFSRQIPQEDMCHIREWPHGHIVADWSCTEKSIRYVCEYLQGDNKDTAWFQMSKKPALGAAWFAKKAQAYIDADVLPSSFEYLPPGGKPGKVYLMTGATRRDFLNAIIKGRAKRSNMSKWVGKTFDKLERQDHINSLDGGLPWPDDHFAKRQRSVESVQKSIADEDLWAAYHADQILERMKGPQKDGASSHPPGRVRLFPRPGEKERFWNVPTHHLYYEPACAFDIGGYPGYFNAKWAEQYFQAGYGSAGFRRRYRSSKVREPATFDRQGRPVGSEREPLSGLYDRDRPAPDDAEGGPFDADDDGSDL